LDVPAKQDYRRLLWLERMNLAFRPNQRGKRQRMRADVRAYIYGHVTEANQLPPQCDLGLRPFRVLAQRTTVPFVMDEVRHKPVPPSHDAHNPSASHTAT
ncbi:MAG TPA: hypothetical protein VK573_08360, partial [Gemmatimonadales bacterium]|nr:hypothetical protein [Gemmatimonadales bacterium]